MEYIGPVIALNKPSSLLPYAGALKLTVEQGKDWKEIIKEIMGRAQLVVIQIGKDTPGLAWEVETATNLLSPKRLVFLVPPKKDCEVFKIALKKHIDVSIPFQSTDSAIYFNNNWDAKILKSPPSHLNELEPIFTNLKLKVNLRTDIILATVILFSFIQLGLIIMAAVLGLASGFELGFGILWKNWSYPFYFGMVLGGFSFLRKHWLGIFHGIGIPLIMLVALFIRKDIDFLMHDFVIENLTIFSVVASFFCLIVSMFSKHQLIIEKIKQDNFFGNAKE